MSRIQALTLLLGLLLIAFGLSVDLPSSIPWEDVDGSGTAPSMDRAEGDLDVAFGGMTDPGREAGAMDRIRSEAPDGPRGLVEERARVTLRLRSVEEGMSGPGIPAAGARAQLWRRAGGEGSARRRAMRLSDETLADARGEVRFDAPPGFPLEAFARTGRRGAVTKVAIEPLSPGEQRVVDGVVELPPEPLEVQVLDAETGAPIAGASLRAAASGNAGIEHFPGTSRLLKRTDGSGRCGLPGEARRASWLLLDAAGYGPAALDPTTLRGQTETIVRLRPAGTLDVLVVDRQGEPVAGALLEARYSLDDFETASSAQSGRRGRATLGSLPPGVAIVPFATPEGGSPQQFEPVTVQPGQTLELRLAITTDQ